MRAQSEFNWMFVIVAGVIILAFFVNFAFKYKSFQDEKLSIELLINLDNSLSTLQASPYSTFDTISLPRDLEITCNNLQIANKKYPNEKIIFSPKNLKDKIYIYYKQFNFPFKIENFYYIISSKDKFYLVYNINDAISREFAESLINNLPDKFKQNVNLVSSKQPNGKNIFINLNSNTNDVKIFLNQDKTSISYNNKVYNDVNQELVYAAIFSDDFECNYNKIKPAMEKLILIYLNKLTSLQNSNCNYASFTTYLQKLKDLNYQDIKPVEELNKNLASLNCPVLY